MLILPTTTVSTDCSITRQENFRTRRHSNSDSRTF